MLKEVSMNPRVRDKSRWPPIHWAAENGYAEAIKLFKAADANVAVQDMNRQTPVQQIKGNGQADAEAKKAAQSLALGRKHRHSALKSSCITAIKQLAKTQWK